MSRKRIQGITIELDGDTKGLDKALGDVNKKSRDLQSELRDVERLLKFSPGNAELAGQKQKLLAEQVEATSDKLNQLRDAQEEVDRQFRDGEIGEDQYRAFQREIVETESKLKHFESQLEDTKGTLDKMADSAAKAGEGMKKAGDKMIAGGKQMTKKVTAPIVGVGVAATKMASDFDDSMAKVSTIADTDSVPLDKLRKQIIDLSNETGVAAENIADDVYNAISAGQDTADAVNFVEKSSKLAKAGFADTGASLDLLTTIMNAYGMEAEDVGDISDMLIQTQNQGKVTVDELASSMGKIIPTANSMGVELDQVSAGYAILTSNGIKSAEATTYMNSMMNELGKTGSRSDKALREMTGSSFRELIEEGHSVADVLELLSDNAEQNGENLTDMFGSAEAGRAALTLLGDDASDFNDMMGKMNDSAGSTEEAFEKMQTPGEQARIAINKLKNVMIELGDVLLPVLAQGAEYVAMLADRFAQLDDSTKKMIVVVGGIVAAIGPLLIVVGTIAKSVGHILTLAPKLLTAGKAVAGVVGAISAPVLLAAAAIAALVAGGILLWRNWDTVKEKAAEFRDWIANTFSQLRDRAVEAITNMRERISEGFANMRERVRETVRNMVDGVIEFFVNLRDRAFEIVSNLWNGVRERIQGMREAVVNRITGMRDIVVETFSNMWSRVTEGISNAFSNVINGVKEIATGIRDTILALPGEALEWGKDIARGLADGIKNMAMAPVNAARDMASNVGGRVKGFFGISSPSKLFKEYGENTGEGFQLGLESMTRKVGSAAQKMSEAANINVPNNRGSATTAGATMNHTGVIRVEGVNSRGETMEVVNIVVDQLRREMRG